MNDDDPVPLCPSCDEPMALSGVMPAEPLNLETRRYACLACGEVLTFSEDAPADQPARQVDHGNAL